MGILANAMRQHLAQCAAAGYHAREGAPCPFIPPAANDAWTIGRFLHEQGMPPPHSVAAIGEGRYNVDGVALQVASHDLVQLLQ